MRRAPKLDGNQHAIVKALQGVGASVQSLASVGDGCVDLLVGYRAANYIMEIKDPSKPPSKRKLTLAQAAWHARWRGQKAIVETVDQALYVIGAVRTLATAEATP